MKGIKFIILFFVSIGNIWAQEEVTSEDSEVSISKVIINAGIIPLPGDSITITVKFDTMGCPFSPIAKLVIDDNEPQIFCKGKWSADGKTWFFDKENLGSTTGLGKLVVEVCEKSAGQLMARREVDFLVGREVLLSKLEEIGSWILDHRHEFIFVEGYDYRTLLALYEITGKEEYLDATRKGVKHILGKQHTYGHWYTGYGNTYLADTGSALAALVNYYKYADQEEKLKIDDAFQLYYDMMLVKGDGTGQPFVNKEGYLGIGFRDFKDGQVKEPWNKPYTISTALSGAAMFGISYYMNGEVKHKVLAINSVDWLLATQNDEGIFPYIIDDWDPKRENAWKKYLYCSSTYVGEGLIAAYTYLNDPVLNNKIENALEKHVGWLLKTQNEDGSWGKDKTFSSTRGHGVVNVLSFYYNHVKQNPQVAEAIRQYYLLLFNETRISYKEVARHPIEEWEWKVAGEYVSTALCGRALAEILKPDVDCNRWKEMDVGWIAPVSRDSTKREIMAPAPVITPWDDLIYGIKSRNDWHNKSKVLRKRFLELIGDDAKPAMRPPLDITIHESVDVEGVYTRKLISYNVESDERAWAYLTFPNDLEKGERYPAVVILHGTAVEGKDIVAGFMPRPVHKGQGYMDDLARCSYVTIAPDHFNMGQRLPPEGTYHTDILYNRHPKWSALGKIIYDASIAIDVLETIESVDSTRIGAVGHSLGGTATVYLAAYDQRIVVAACNDGAYPFRFNTRMDQYIRSQGQFSYFPKLKPLIDKGRLPSIDIHEISALIAPRAYLDNISLNDIYGPTQEGHKQRVLMDLRLADVWNLEGAVANFAFYVRSQKHSCQHDNNELVYAWLDKHLGQPRARLLRKVEK